MVALGRERDGSDVFARAMECGKSLAQALQRGKKTWENGRGLWKPVEVGPCVSGMSDGLIARLLSREACDDIDFFVSRNPVMAWHSCGRDD